MKKLKNKGFAGVHFLPILLVFGIIGGIGYYVWQKNSESKRLIAITTFDQCKADKDSKIQESLPEVCVTADGKRLTNTAKTVQQSDIPADEPETTFVKFSTIDPELQAKIKALYDRPADFCQYTNVKAANYVNLDQAVQKYEAKTAAFVGIGCDGGSVHLFGYKNGQWIDDYSTQQGFMCSDLKKYNVPSSFTKTCYSADGKEVSYP